MGNIKLWLWVFFVMIIVANGCLDEERSALFELQADMIGAALTWVGYNESGSQDCCSWGGVQCSLATGRVIKLDLESFDGWNFNASLFLSFKSLEVLILSRNHIGLTKIEGIDKLSHLTNLKVLDLRHNSLHPSVLSSLCRISSLEVLKLSSFRWKNYTGHIGEGNVKCRGLRNLRVLLLNNYGIDDISILSVLGLGTHIGLKNLEKLYLSGNSFNSSIFSSLKDLPSLTHLDLSYNEIHGKIEMSDIIALSNLKFLNLEGNEFESFVTTKGSKRVSYLRKLELGGSNSNSTKVLQSLKSFSSLHSLSYIDTHLTAPAITYALANLSTLEYLYLDRSSLNANFPSSIGQMTSLKVLRLAFGGNNGILPSQGWCELKNIQELSLSGFEGTLPSCLGNLTSLKYLDLNGNGFTGNIDSHPFWRRLTSLEFLDISSNQFVVPLSFKLFANHSKLIYLDVSSNTITTDTEFQNWIPSFQLQLFAIHGNTNLQKLPSFLHYQYDLRILAIDGNQLPGNFPTWLLENNTRLGGLYASYNAFIGPLELPSTSLPRLHTIYVSNNKLNGHIPANFSSAFPKINRLDMSHNLIEGPIPSGVSGIPLQYVDLSHNFLSGGVPSDLISSPTLYDLRLSNNKLKGQIFLKDFRSGIPSYLYLNGNNFEGPLPSNIFLRDLVVLDASNNNFSGEIPRRIRDNSRLLQLDLSNNHFEGSIPVEICNMKSIKVLAMSENRLSGNIPSCVSSLPLQHIHLDKNQLDGGLEYVLSNISSLITLDVGYNSFTGSIPHTIGSLSNLNFLLLNHNQLEGNIPAQICLLNELSIMDLSFNKIYGSLLPCLGNLIQAKRDVEIWFITYTSYSNEAWSNFLTWKSSTMHYHNRYSMGRPDSSTMDVVTQVQFSTKRNTYTYEGSVLHYMSGIDLSSNKLTGEIPIELGNLSNIHALNLSHNHLIGRIPESFSYLLEVESLDLSYNSLNGSIPVGLLELHPLEVFSVAYNNLSGKVPDFKGQFGTFDKSSYEGNPFLCGYPLDNECRSTKLSNTSKNESDESDLDDKESFYIGFCVSYGAILLGLAAALCFNPHWRRAWFRLVESLMLTSYYFLLDNVVSPFKNWW